jgi:hypothetical protein
MLRLVDARLTQLAQANTTTLAERTLTPTIEGLGLAVAAYPTVTVDPGSLVLPNGTVYGFAGGSFVSTQSAWERAYFYISSDYTIETASVIPETAVAALGRVVINGDATDFYQLKNYGLETLDDVNDNDQLTETRVYRGPICLEVAGYDYDSDGLPLAFIESSAYESQVKTYSYSTDGELESVSVSPKNKRYFYLDGSVVLDDSEVLDGGEIESLTLMPYRYLTADGSRYADGTEFANGEL